MINHQDIKFINDHYNNLTHMPFILNGKDNQIVLLFCAMINYNWRLCYYIDKDHFGPIQVNIKCNHFQCSPICYYDKVNDRYNITFTSVDDNYERGVFVGSSNTFKQFDNLTLKHKCVCGYHINEQYCIANNCKITFNKDNIETYIAVDGDYEITRLCPHKEGVLVTIVSYHGQYTDTYYIDLKTQQIGRFLVNNNGIYKCIPIDDKQIIIAIKCGHSLEHRMLMISDNYSIQYKKYYPIKILNK